MTLTHLELFPRPLFNLIYQCSYTRTLLKPAHRSKESLLYARKLSITDRWQDVVEENSVQKLKSLRTYKIKCVKKIIPRSPRCPIWKSRL